MYILQSKDANGITGFYSGRAAKAWITAKRDEAFAYQTLQAARTKAAQFNRTYLVHGEWFVAIPQEAAL